MGQPSSLVESGRSSAQLMALGAPLVLAVLVVLFTPPARGESQRPGVQATPAAVDGQMLYQRDCSFCHGANGEGTPRGQSLREVGPAEVDYSVSTGRMPIADADRPRRRRPVRYQPEEIQALIGFMRPFLAPEPNIAHVDADAGDLAHGGELYQSECASCHQSAGAGGGLLGREAPSLFSATPLQAAEAIRSGPATMPGFGPEALSDHDVDSIVRYVEYLKDPEDRGGNPIWHLGPLPEGLVVWVVGMGLLIVAVKWIGEQE